MEVRKNVRIINPQGLHARPCHAIVSAALDFESDLRVSLDGREVNGRSILELMTLVAPIETVLCLRAVGEDAERLVARISTLIESGFDELD